MTDDMVAQHSTEDNYPNVRIAETSDDPLLQRRNALTIVTAAAEMLLKQPCMANHAATIGGVLAFYRWCERNETNAQGCLTLALMARDDLAPLMRSASGKACGLLAVGQQQTERLIYVLEREVGS